MSGHRPRSPRSRTCCRVRRTHSASAPRSPVRTRTTVSTRVTQTLPSPILPVRAALTTASTTRSTAVVVDDHLDAHLGHEVHLVVRAPVELGVPALPTVARHLTDRHPRHVDAARVPDATSSRAKGLRIAVTSIIGQAPPSGRDAGRIGRGRVGRRRRGPAAPGGATGPGLHRRAVRRATWASTLGGLSARSSLPRRRRSRARPCGPGSRCRPGSPRPSRHRSCRCGRTRRSASTTLSARVSSATTSTRTFGTKSTEYSAPR